MRRQRQATAALYVRLPIDAADRLDKAAERLAIPKKELVVEMVDRYLSTEGSGAPAEAVASGTALLGRYSFHEYPEPEVMTLEEAATFLKVSPEDLLEEVSAARVPAQRIGQSWRFSRAALVQWLSAGGSA